MEEGGDSSDPESASKVGYRSVNKLKPKNLTVSKLSTS